MTINDVLDKKVVMARGVRFDAEYNVTFRKVGNDIEIYSEELGPISAVVGNEFLLLDQYQLKGGYRSFYNDILKAFGEEALRQAHLVVEYKWEVVEYV